MNRQIRRLGVVIGLLFLALFVNLNYIQVVRADKLKHDPRNGRIAFNKQQAWVKHDQHYHVDFDVACR